MFAVATPTGVEVRGFSSGANAQGWLKASKLQEQVLQLQQQAAKLQQATNRVDERVNRRMDLIQDRIAADLEDLAKSSKLPVSSLELLRLASKPSEFEPPILESLRIFEHANYSGATLFQYKLIPIPSFNIFKSKLRNKVSSLQMSYGIAALYDDTWFRGNVLYLISGPGGLQIPDLTPLGWNDRFESSQHC